jgi:anti-anti-sigma regulatory factor
MYRVMAAVRRDPPPPGVVTIAADDGAAVLVLAGEVDVVAVRAFEDAHGAEPAVTAIDAGDVTLLSATAASLMIRAANAARAAGRRVELVRTNAHVDRVLQLLDAGDVFSRAGRRRPRT